MRKVFFLIVIVIGSFFTGEAQTTSSATAGIAAAAKYDSRQIDSKLMGRGMPYRVVLPPTYQQSNETTRYPIIYLLHGLSGHFTNWTDKTSLTDFAAKHAFIIVTPEGDNGWYTDSVAAPNDKYESYIVKELIPR